MTLLPYRMNWQEVQIQQLIWDSGLADVDFRETAGQKRYNSVITLRCQVIFNKFYTKAPSWTGNIDESDGHLVFKISDLLTAGITLHRGDRVVGLQNQSGTFDAADLEIMHLLPRGHLPVPLTLHVYFVERTEERATV